MNKLKKYIIIGIIFVLITGIISHFVYEWSGNNMIIALFFPVNESTWEHMKLCFFPMLFYYFYMKEKTIQDYPCVDSGMLFGILLSTLLIPIMFYTYTGILGNHFLFLDIATFIISVLVAFAAVYRLTLSCALEPYTRLLKLMVLVTMICFFVFTFYPPDIGIFVDPIEKIERNVKI